jgi:hypothetical protein
MGQILEKASNQISGKEKSSESFFGLIENSYYLCTPNENGGAAKRVAESSLKDWKTVAH